MLETALRKRPSDWIGHVPRLENYGRAKQALTGFQLKKRTQCRPHITWKDTVCMDDVCLKALDRDHQWKEWTG